MYEKYGQFIDGKWQKSSSGETYDVINPATEEVIGKASKANSEDIQKALKSAEKGLKIWRNTSPWDRSKIIRKISELMKQRVDVLSKWLTLEVGKPLTEGPGEIGGAADIFEWNSEETKRIFGEINQSRFPNTKIHLLVNKNDRILYSSISVDSIINIDELANKTIPKVDIIFFLTQNSKQGFIDRSISNMISI